MHTCRTKLDSNSKAVCVFFPMRCSINLHQKDFWPVKFLFQTSDNKKKFQNVLPGAFICQIISKYVILHTRVYFRRTTLCDIPEILDLAAFHSSCQSREGYDMVGKRTCDIWRICVVGWLSNVAAYKLA